MAIFVSVEDASKRFEEMVAAVDRVEAFIITRDGRPFAKLVADRGRSASPCPQDVLDRFDAFAADGINLDYEKIDRSLLHER